MLKADNISFNIGGRYLLRDISAAFEPGKLHLVVGPNGAGKSTLVKLLARLMRPTSGSVQYDGFDITNVTDADLARRRSVLSQAVEAAFPLIAQEIVMMGRYPHMIGRPGESDQKIVDEVCEFFEVTEFLKRNYQTLSGGERQRVNFARVMTQIWRASDETRFLLLDEPLTFLDIRHQIDFMKKIREFSSSDDVVTVGVVHDLSLAARFADNIVVLDQGRIAATGKPHKTLTVDLIRKVFGVESTVVTTPEAHTNLVFY